MRALVIALCLLATQALADVAGVASVIDGDTIEVHGQRVRLHGIDAPEIGQVCSLKSYADCIRPCREAVGGAISIAPTIPNGKGCRW